jgi:hypothetical protein
VRAVIDAEVARRRRGGPADSAFVADRDAIAQRFRLGATDAHAVSEAAASLFYATGSAGTLPDMVALYEEVTPAMLAALLRERLPVDGDNVRLFRPIALPPIVLAALAVLLVWVVVAILRRALLQPVDMRRVRYVARFRVDVPIVLALLLVVGGVGAVGLRLLAAAARPFLERMVFPRAPRCSGYYAGCLAIMIATLVVLGRPSPGSRCSRTTRES